MSGPSGEAGAAQTRWQFIDTSKNSRSNLTQVKRHVMQEYMRQKKGDSHLSDEEIEAPPRRKRGRPRKSEANKRDLASKSKASKGSSNKQRSQSSDEDVAVDVDEIDHSIISTSTAGSTQGSTQANETEAPEQTFPLRMIASDFGLMPHNGQFSSGFIEDEQDLIDNSPDTRLAQGLAYANLEWSPKSIMSAARTDPFNSLPLELDLDGQRLFDFYVSDMPSCSYGGHYRSGKAHNWYRMVFVPEAMKGGVAFQNTILVHAANTWAWVRNETETTRTLLHRDRALTMLREHLKDNPQDDSDVSIISCLSAAALEDFDPRPGHKEISWMHMRAARNMIRSRGGPAAFKHTRLGMLINWQDYILSGYETHGPSFYFKSHDPIATPKHDSSRPQPPQSFHNMPSPPSSVGSPPLDPTFSSTLEIRPTFEPQGTPIDEIRLQCEEFLDYLRRCEQLALYQREYPESCSPARISTVQESSILYQVIAAPPGARFTASGDRKQMVARLTALILLNAGLWDYRYTPDLAGTFMATLEQAMINSEVSMSGSVEAILQILLECNDGVSQEWIEQIPLESRPDYSQYSYDGATPSARPWFAGRMLKIAKRLSAESWHRVNEMLFSCLILQTSELSFYLWEADLRREILDAPLTCYTMPSLLE